MKIEKFHVYLADLNPRMGTEPGKIRPVVVVQTDLLNNQHPSTIICPLTANIIKESKILRVHVPKGQAGLQQSSSILIDQIRAIDNRRFHAHLGVLNASLRAQLLENLKILVLE